ncbi:MAG: QueT transporter family protein [Candidatus Odinarchaeota archaeon]|nr:QueT transporter family protein [Candidatus Odinarchaeota archaeon]
MYKISSCLDMALVAIFAALYAIGVIALAPISYGIVQVRVADALIPLSAIFGYPAILGVTIGCLVANIYSPFGAIDIIGGTVANFVASWLSYKLRKNIIMATTAATLAVTVIVGSYLTVLLGIPIIFISILIGSFIAINIIGGTLIVLLRKSEFIQQFIKEE